MRIGVDFDNTIVSYDALFRRVAGEQGLVPEAMPASKTEVRNYLRKVGREDAWTAMQGVVYGQRMTEACAFPGVVEFFRACKQMGIPTSIISHRTQHPIVGEKYDLHAAARKWLDLNGVTELVLPENIHFELTREAKRERVKAVQPTHFIDDLPEFLEMPGFPAEVRRILFDPLKTSHAGEGIESMTSWQAIREHLAL